MKHKSKSWLLGAGLALLLASCGVQKVEAPTSSSDGEPVPLALAQSLVLGMEVSAGG